MKNWKKIAIMILMGTVLLLPNEANATSIGFTDLSIKNIFLFIAILILILLFYLGYRMDSNDNAKVKEPKTKKKNNNLNEKARYSKQASTDDLYNFNDKEYEEDSREYEVDDVNPEEISESIEYEEDEEDDDNNDSEMSLFESVQNNNDFGSTINFDTSDLRKELNKSSISNENEFDLTESVDNYKEDDLDNIMVAPVVGSSIVSTNNEEDDEEYGEEFDTSIIDKIDEEDEDFEDIVTSPVSNPVIDDEFDDIIPLNNIEDEESLDEEYGEEFDTSIIDRIDEENETIEEDPFIKKMNSFKEPETDFAGFSVASTTSEKTHDETINQKRYTKTKPKVVEKVVENSDFSDSSDLDFLRQMERNLELGNKNVIPEATKVTKTRKKVSDDESTKVTKITKTRETKDGVEKVSKTSTTKNGVTKTTKKTTTRKKKVD